MKKGSLLRKARLRESERVDAIITRRLYEGRPFITKELRFASLPGKSRKKHDSTPGMLLRAFQLIGETIENLLGTHVLPLAAHCRGS